MIKKELLGRFFISAIFSFYFFIITIVYAQEPEVKSGESAQEVKGPRSVLLKGHLQRLKEGNFPPLYTTRDDSHKSMVTYIPRAYSRSPTLSSPPDSSHSDEEGRLSREPSRKRVSFNESENTVHNIRSLNESSCNSSMSSTPRVISDDHFGRTVPELIRELGPSILPPCAIDPSAEEVCVEPSCEEIPTAPGELPGAIDEIILPPNPSPIHKLVTSARHDARKERSMKDLERVESSCCCVVS